MMKRNLFILIFWGLVLIASSMTRTRLDEGWLTKVVNDANVDELMKIDGGDWTSVSLPHDWSVTYAPDSTANAGNDGGYLPGVKAIYVNNLYLPQLEEGRYALCVEGAYMNPTVWVNGDMVGTHVYGYTTWRVDITDSLIPGDNVIVITVDNSKQKNSRWYSGTGIIRPVYLEHYAPYSVDAANLYVTTSFESPDVALAHVEAVVKDRHYDRLHDVTIHGTVEIVDPDGVELCSRDYALDFKGNSSEEELAVDISIPHVQLWSLDSPRLYTAIVSVDNGDGVIDRQAVKFGVREFAYDVDNGAMLNGEPIKISGACVHHDNGMLGAAACDAAEWHRVALLKRAGFNAVRTSHNPPSVAFLDACDALGMLVIDEAFDGWKDKKTDHDYGEVFETEWPGDLAAMITRDRCHPSVIAWSIGNEILERKSSQAVEWAKQMSALCHRLDPSRTVTQALAAWDSDWEIYDPLAAAHDIVGYNYMIQKAEGDHERVPERVMWQTESYPRDAWSNYLKVRELPYVIGDFVWTGMDYIGESGIGRHYYDGEVPGEHYERNLWPWHTSQCGDIDFIGRRKPISYYRDMLYNGLDTVYMAVREPDGYRGVIKETLWGTYPTYESWTWPGHEGKPIEVEVVSRYPIVQLYLNDNLVGTKTSGELNEYKSVFTLPYTHGELKAVGCDSNGVACGAMTLRTAGEPTDICKTIERCSAPGTDYDLLYVNVDVCDSDGTVNPEQDVVLEFEIPSGTTLLGTASADPKDTIAYNSPRRRTYRGHAQGIYKLPHGAETPVIVVSMTGEGH